VAAVGIPADRVICSDLARARETAELLGVRPAAYDPDGAPLHGPKAANRAGVPGFRR
jgi:phosphohistidine phosphatase SixA